MKTRSLLAHLALATILLVAAEAHASEDSLHVVDTGSGRPVVIIPWLVGGAYGFRNVLPLLGEGGYRTVVIEPLGVGESARPREADYSLDAQTDRVAVVLDRLDLREAIVVGHGLGGAIAYRLAAARPDLVRAIISIEGHPAETAASPGLKKARRFAFLIKLFATKGKVRKRMREGLIASSGNASWVVDDVVDRYAAPATANVKRAIDVLAAIARSREREPLRGRLPSIRCPVELLIGTAPHQGSMDQGAVELLRSSIPDFSVTRVPGAGFFIQEECPEAIRSAVDRHAGTSRKSRRRPAPRVRRGFIARRRTCGASSPREW